MGKGNKSRGPVWKQDPGAQQKQVRGTERAEESNALPFRWRSGWIDLDGEWGFRNAPCEHLWQEVIPRLHELETMTWGELYGRRDGSTHPMPVENIEKPAQRRLADLGREQYDTLFQINVRGKTRLWGIRDRAYFYLIWYDPDHTVYRQK